MNPYRARRATTDDLEQLLTLWKAVNLPALELEKHFTDFQVIEDQQGKLAAAIGMTISGHDARIHSESFADFGLTDTLRPLFWDRLENIAKNHGLFRLWTDETAPFWKKEVGFNAPSEQAAHKWPESFGAMPHGCLMLQLRDESAAPDALERELANYKRMEQERLDTLKSRAKVVNVVMTLIVGALFVGAVVIGFLFITKGMPQ